MANLSEDEVVKYIQDMPYEVLGRIQFNVPWAHSEKSYASDADGVPTRSDKSYSDADSDEIREECWLKFNGNPQINTSVRGIVGRLVGLGFETTSEVEEIQEEIRITETDHRNRLYNFWPQFVGRHYVEGELYLCFTAHNDGFIEVDYIYPESIEDIQFHPFKTVMPLFYNIKTKKVDGSEDHVQIPSIFIARYPELVQVASQDFTFFNKTKQKSSVTRRKKFKSVGGYNRFIVGWTKGLVTKRAVGYLRTVLEWLNKYEMLKNWEIDHKRAAGAYVWKVTCDDPRKFKLWLSLSDDDKKKTGLTAKKTPGATIMLPPGFDIIAASPQLPNISDSDTDIMDMVISGLNENENVTMGKNRGTFASAKEARGPMSDRTSDEMAYFERFVRYDFWGNIFFLKQKIGGFPESFRRWEAVRFDKEGEPEFQWRRRTIEELIDLSFPVSESIDFEGRAKGLLGVKHGPITDTLGVPGSTIAKKLGFGGYGRLRLQHATEKERYPTLIYSLDAESLQEQAEAEPGTPDKKPGMPAKKEKKDEADQE